MGLLLLFNQQQESGGQQTSIIQQDEILKILNIQDAETRENVPVLGFQSESNYVQGLIGVTIPLKFYQVGSGLAGGELTDKLELRGLTNLILKLNFSDPSSVAQMRVILEDVNGLKIVSELIAIASTNEQENGKYLGEYAMFKTHGASYAQLKIETISSGTLDVFLAET